MATLFHQLTSELVPMWFLTLKSRSFLLGPDPCYSKLSRGKCTWTIISKNTKQATLSYNGTNLVGKSAIEKYTRIGMIDQTERHVTMLRVGGRRLPFVAPLLIRMSLLHSYILCTGIDPFSSSKRAVQINATTLTRNYAGLIMLPPELIGPCGNGPLISGSIP